MVPWISIAILALVGAGIYYAINQGAEGTDKQKVAKSPAELLEESDGLQSETSKLRNYYDALRLKRDPSLTMTTRIDNYKKLIEELLKLREELLKLQEALPEPEEKLHKPEGKLPKPEEKLHKPKEKLHKPEEKLPKPEEKLHKHPKPHEKPLQPPVLPETKTSLATTSERTGDCGQTHAVNIIGRDLLVTQFKNGIKDICLSPLTIYLVMLIILAGQEPKKQQKVLESMSIQGCSFDEILSNFQDLMKSIKDHKEGVKINIANLGILSKFLPDLIEEYKVKMEKSLDVNFLREDLTKLQNAKKTINDRIADLTENQIPNFIEKESTLLDLKAIIISAMFFEGKWEKSFVEIPGLGDFYSTPTTKVPIQFMQNEAKYRYAFIRELKCEAVEIDFKSDEYTLLLMMPVSGTTEDLDNFIRKLHSMSDNDWEDLYKLLEEEKLKLKLPIFSLASDTLDILSLMTEMFGKDFGEAFYYMDNAVKDYVLRISQVLHKSKFDVGPKGATGASVSAGLMTRTPGGPIEVEFDKPFYFELKGEIGAGNKRDTLLVGLVYSPKK